MAKNNKADQIIKQFDGETTADFIESITQMQKDAYDKGGDPTSFRFETEVEHDYDGVNAHLVLGFQRPETDKEERDRLQLERDMEVQQEQTLRRLASNRGFDLVPKDKS